MFEKYEHYFNIDPEYFPQVNAAVINKNPDMWKKYYPHETFIKLLKDTVRVLDRSAKLSIWVEGAYGTGKSHAVLTLKKLLDASEEDTRAYFQRYNLDNDLCNRIQGLKNSGTILTVHRYGSSNIRGDHNLVFAIQESIEAALREKGLENRGSSALKTSIVQWLSDEAHKVFFDMLIKEKYREYFLGDDTDAVIKKLQTYDQEALIPLMDKIFKVADEEQIKMLSLDTKGLTEWIREIISANDLKAIVFIWDEFTEYFINNTRELTGFQEIAEISATDPFYLMIVTHKSAGLFSDADKDKTKILDRFVKPTCIIELPENMAFQLMGAAMEKNKDPMVLSDWEMMVDDLYDRTRDSRTIVKNTAGISDTELQNILPIHPYAALLLKHISSAFDSNQRSMFDFIKNDRGDEIKGFQWFIKNNGPDDENPLLTVDMLWDFFYEKGKEYLSADIRAILDCYVRASTKKLTDDEKRVLKCALLLQSISQKVGDAVELFIPNEKNINNAFEGSDLDNGRASRCADKLVRDEVLYKKPLSANTFQYSALVNAGDMAAVEKFKDEVRRKSTSTLVTEGELLDGISLSGALRLRYYVKAASASDFDISARQLRGSQSNLGNRIPAIISFAKNDEEMVALGKKIKGAVDDESYDMVFIDASVTTLGTDAYEQYVEAMANSMYQRGKDNAQANQYENNAKDVLRKWRGRIADGEFIIYTHDKPEGERIVTVSALYEALKRINKRKYPNCLEGEYNVIENMYAANSLKVGVGCGIERETSGTFKSGNPATKLESALSEAWTEERYWETKPYLLISKIKKTVDEVIADAFEKDGRVAIGTIYDVLKEAPFGFMPCNLTAFIMGFVLKEYADESYSWSDGLTNDVLNVTKMKEMVDEVIKQQQNRNPRYRDKYIVTMTPEEKQFNDGTAEAFDISRNLCTSIEQTRDRVRNRMKDLAFPIWTLKSIVKDESLTTDTDTVLQLIDRYSELANNNNAAGNKSDSDIAMEIGTLLSSHADAPKDLRRLLTSDQCTKGMQAFLQQFEGGLLPQLASEVRDQGQYINALKAKFDAADANWVWNQETGEQKIRETILEYRITAESNKVNAPATSFDAAIQEWMRRCDNIRISYTAGKQVFGGLAEFLDILWQMKKAGSITEQQKRDFYEQMVAHGEEYKYFYSNQNDVFQRVCAYNLNDFDAQEKAEIFQQIPTGCFTKDKTEYFAIVEKQIEEYRSSQGKLKLRALWRDKTGTENPRDWSKKYTMPILCMVEDDEVNLAKGAFGALNRAHPDQNSIQRAMHYLENTRLFERLNSQEEREEAFRKFVVKDYAVLLPDFGEVKRYLDKNMNDDPYDWYGVPKVDRLIREMAEAKYAQGGSAQALSVIDQMETEDVKRYLKELIKDNLRVGLEIIKNR